MEIDVEIGHSETLKYFPDLDYTNCQVNGESANHLLDYRRTDNVVGHQQRAFVLHWAVDSIKSGLVGIELGGFVHTPGVIDVDKYAGDGTGRSDGLNPHIQCDACNMSMLRSGKWGNVISNHVLEHIDDPDIVVWEAHRLMVSGRYFAMIVPDASVGPWNYPDENHQVAFVPHNGVPLYVYDSTVVGRPRRVIGLREWVSDICSTGKFEPVECCTLNNNFSLNMVIRKV